MTATLKIIDPGLHTTIQDRGRLGFQSAGVPVSGALDLDSLAIANALVGNEPDEAALEIRYSGPTLLVNSDWALIALTGTSASLAISGDAEDRSLPSYRSIRLKRGSRIALPALGDSATAYIAVAGGFEIQSVLGSRSTYVRGGFGGFKGRSLQAGDEIPLGSESAGDRNELVLSTPPALTLPSSIRAVAGPQSEHFTAEALEIFTSSAWRIGEKVDRMGMRLEGPKLEHRHGHDIVSDGIVTGSIQVPGTGRPIILLADRQTTGGYPKIATVISSDLGAIGRARIGGKLYFHMVTAAEAQSIREKHVFRQKQLLAAMVPISTHMIDKLYRENLISGVYGEN
jgi:biotin-dependent carboxylase-like uncharacterized protein